NHRILLRGIEVHRLDNDAPDIGLAVAAFGDEDFGEVEAGGEKRGSVALIEVGDYFLVFGAAELRDRRQIDTLPGVDVVLAIGREGDGVGAIGFGERREAHAVEVDAAELREVGILAGDEAAGVEIDLALVLIDVINIADEPLALGDLVLHLAGETVIEIEVLPAIALAGPDDVLTVIEVAAEAAAGGEAGSELVVIDERLALLVNEGAHGAGLRVHFEDAIDLMAALVVFEGEAAAVFPPYGHGDVVRVGEERAVDFDFLFGGYIEERRVGDIDGIAGLAVHRTHGGVRHGFGGEVLGLNLVRGRRLNVVDLAIVTGARMVADDVPGVGRPCDRTQRIVVAFGAVEAERRSGLGGTDRLQEDVVVLDDSVPLAVEGAAGFSGSSGCGSTAASGATASALRLGSIGRPRGACELAAGCKTSGSALLRVRLELETVHRVAAVFF